MTTRKLVKYSIVFGSSFVVTMLASAAVAQVPETDETWLLNVSGGGTSALADPDEERFQPGFAGSAGVYRSLSPKFQLGARIGGGVVYEDQPVPGASEDGNVEIGNVAAMMRVTPFGTEYDDRRGTGLWLEAGGGPSVIGGDVYAAIESGVGYNFDAGAVGIGPSFRYTHGIEADDRFLSDDARMATLGMELTFLDDVDPNDRPIADNSKQPIEVTVNVESVISDDADGDAISNASDVCPYAKETFNGVNDQDGCPDSTQVTMSNDKVMIDEQVFFGFDNAKLTETGEQRLKEIATKYHADGKSWSELKIIGHADSRGSTQYNYDLSEERAEVVAEELARLGLPEDIIVTQAYGEMAPVVNAENQGEHSLNRRVEFRIVRDGASESEAAQ